MEIAGFCAHPDPRCGDLLVDHALIERHDHHVVEVEPLAGVVENPNDVGQVVQLVFGEELVMEIERSEYIDT